MDITLLIHSSPNVRKFNILYNARRNFYYSSESSAVAMMLCVFSALVFNTIEAPLALLAQIFLAYFSIIPASAFATFACALVNLVYAGKWFDAKVLVSRPGLCIVRRQPQLISARFFANAATVPEI